MLLSRLITSAFIIVVTGCFDSHDDSLDPVLHGTIHYPFADRQNPMGINGPSEKFVIKSAVGPANYTIEIPSAADDYDVHIPIAALDGAGDGSFDGNHRFLGSPSATDREIVKDLPQVDASSPEKAALLDTAFGVGKAEGPKQSPSYVLNIAKINKLYKKRMYEYALVEINNMLTFYPTSAKLYKMKGTVLAKMQQLRLAEKAWARAKELAPSDRVLQRGIERLRQRIATLGLNNDGQGVTPQASSQGGFQPLNQRPAIR